MQLFNIFPDSKLSSKGVGGKGGGGGDWLPQSP